jgi:predicted  nucleic acid-binding Zn-ribbon protein
VAEEVQSVHKLAALQDIDLMIREHKGEEEMGFDTKGIEALEKARARLASEIDGRWLRIYERLRQKHERAVVPVIDHTCLGCSMAVPTAKRKSGEDRTSGTIVVCESCGRILFFV